mgnify:CR=1 FL=1
MIVFSPQKEEISTFSGTNGLPGGKIGEVVQEILFCEVEKSSWTLMHRYYKVVELLKSGKMDSLNRDHMVYIYIWLRYSFSK